MPGSQAADSEDERRALVDLLRRRGITDPHVLRAVGAVPRERFVPDELRGLAYADGPLPIGRGQTISQPYVVAVMLQELGVTPEHRVLEVGTGSGYAAAVLAAIARHVYTIERIAALADLAADRLRALGNVTTRCGDGSLGWQEEAPFDRILVSAGAPAVPAALQRQLGVGGILVLPVGPTPEVQRLVRVVRTGAYTWEESAGEAVSFVPLVGAEGFSVR